jgi:transcription elongation GreA/GreB family factor
VSRAFVKEDSAAPAPPLARALEGAVPSETVELHAGGAVVPVEVLAVGRRSARCLRR